MTRRRGGSIPCIALLAIAVTSASHAEGGSRPSVSAGTEVLTGSIDCGGSVYSDGQNQSVQAIIYLSGTSDIVSDFMPYPAATRDAPGDLDAMRQICTALLEATKASAPPICALTPIQTERGEFGNGASTYSRTGFVCEGRRDAVVRAVGYFTRAVVLADLH